MFLTVTRGTAPRFAITTGGGGGEQQINGTGAAAAEHLVARRGHPVGHDRHAVRQRHAGRHEHQHDPAPGRPRQHEPELDRPLAVRRPALNATVDDFQIYGRALSAAEVARSPAGSRRRQRRRVPLRRGRGATALDSSGNGRDATIISPPSQKHTALAAAARRSDHHGPGRLWQRARHEQARASRSARSWRSVTATGSTSQRLTAVGKPGTQARLAAAAPAGASNIKVTSTTNITAGDRIRLDIDLEDRERDRRVGGQLRRGRHRPCPVGAAEV